VTQKEHLHSEFFRSLLSHVNSLGLIGTTEVVPFQNGHTNVGFWTGS
jgi:hypothetical protein